MPEKRQRLDKILALNESPKIIKPARIKHIPQPMTFFLEAGQKEIVEKAIVAFRKRAGEKLSRGEILTKLAGMIGGSVNGE